MWGAGAGPRVACGACWVWKPQEDILPRGGTLGRVTSSGSAHFTGEGPPRGLLGVEGENIEARAVC